MKHTLMSVKLGDNSHAHCYLMTDDPAYELKALNVLMDRTDGHRAMDVVLMTLLDDSGVKMVREILSEDSEDAARLLAEPTNFHMTIFAMADEHPRADDLKGLH